MITWIEGMEPLQRVFAMVALPATILLVFQTIIALVFGSFGGAGADCCDGGDCTTAGSGSTDYEGLQVFTIRGLIAFFCIFGWTGLVLKANNVHSALSVLISAVAGMLFMILMAYIFAAFMKLQSNGAIDISSAVGASGTVYLPVPAQRSGSGKVNVLASGRYVEYSAVTDDDAPLPTRTNITVVDVSGNTLVVMRK